MIEINIHEKDWHVYCSNIKEIACELTQIIPSIKGKKISLLLTNDNEMQKINNTFRKKNTATNVLSFSYTKFPDGTIGDIALSLETIRREAEEINISFKEHAIHMLIHGILHIIGYIHEKEEDRKIMESLEDDILAQLDKYF